MHIYIYFLLFIDYHTALLINIIIRYDSYILLLSYSCIGNVVTCGLCRKTTLFMKRINKYNSVNNIVNKIQN